MKLALVEMALVLALGCAKLQSQPSQSVVHASEQPTLRISVLPTQNKTEQERMIRLDDDEGILQLVQQSI
jgi:ABC-type phosphate/phosphonate transport system substrate-binding protein